MVILSNIKRKFPCFVFLEEKKWPVGQAGISFTTKGKQKDRNKKREKTNCEHFVFFRVVSTPMC